MLIPNGSPAAVVFGKANRHLILESKIHLQAKPDVRGNFMKKIVFGLGLALMLSGAVMAQTTSTSGSGSATSKTAISRNGSAVSLASGTQVAAELQKSLNVEKAKVGDEVVLKTTKAIKHNGEVIVEKGSRLVGRVTEVQKRAKDTAGSKIGILFDTMTQGNISMPITATIVSVTSVAARAGVNDSVFADSSASSSTSAGATRQSSGGLLGGVGNTVAGVAGTATNTIGGVTNTAGQTLGSTTGAVGGTIRGLSISQSTDASVSGSSTLSLSSGNLNLDKGTTFNLAVSESARVGSGQKTKPGN